MRRILDATLIWVDYISIPQRSPEVTQLAIQSLSSYASLASEFVIVAPPVRHCETARMCDFGTYRRRTWCRAEQLCHLLRNGLDAMWLATAINEVHPLSSAALKDSIAEIDLTPSPSPPRFTPPPPHAAPRAASTSQCAQAGSGRQG